MTTELTVANNEGEFSFHAMKALVSIEMYVLANSIEMFVYRYWPAMNCLCQQFIKKWAKYWFKFRFITKMLQFWLRRRNFLNIQIWFQTLWLFKQNKSFLSVLHQSDQILTRNSSKISHEDNLYGSIWPISPTWNKQWIIFGCSKFLLYEEKTRKPISSKKLCCLW